MYRQAAQSLLSRYVRKISAVDSAAHSNYAVIFLALTLLLNPFNRSIQLIFTFPIGFKTHLEELFRHPAIVADPFRRKADFRIGRVHHAPSASSITCVL